MTESAPGTTHELHSRVSDGLHIRLLWRAHDDYLWVCVTDIRRGGQFGVEVRDRARTLDVFHHPYAYAALDAVGTTTNRADAATELSVAP